MFTNKEINTFIGLFFAASRSPSPNPDAYRKEFVTALEEYFSCYPNVDQNENPYTAGDFPADEE